MFYFVNIVCNLLFVVEIFSANSQSNLDDTVPGPVRNLYFDNDENWNVFLHWSPPEENAAFVATYRIHEATTNTTVTASKEKNSYNVTSAFKECILLSLAVSSANAAGKESNAMNVNYFLAPKGVISVDTNVMSLSWNISAHNRTCYESIKVEMCSNGSCQTYLAEDRMPTVGNKLTVFREKAIPCMKYIISVSTPKIGVCYRFNGTIKQRVFQKPILHEISNLTAHEASIQWIVDDFDKNFCRLESVKLECVTPEDDKRYLKRGLLPSSKIITPLENLASSTNYSCTLALINIAGESEKSSEVEFRTEDDDSPDINSTTKGHRTFFGNKGLIKRTRELVETIEPNSTYISGNLMYASLMTSVQNISTNITWKNAEVKGVEIKLLQTAVSQLSVGSNVTFVIFEDRNKSKLLDEGKNLTLLLGDIVTVETPCLQPIPNNSLLQIKFDKNKLYHPDSPNWTCVYWDPRISKWNESGIETKFDIDTESIFCLSSHLSTFSILLPNPGSGDEENSQHLVWLTYISRFGSGITICFLILVLAINYGKKTGNETKKILMHSSFALLLTHGTYQIFEISDGKSQCLILSIMKYYFMLAFLLWTAADGINMWRILLVDVFNTKGYRFYLWYKIISWGVPLITTSIGLFYMGSQEKCDLQFNETHDLIFYMVPWIVILCCNMLLFTWILLNITCRNKLGRLKNKKIDYVLALTQVFGIGWCLVFPFFYYKPTRLIGEYLLAGVISTQGVLIFTVRGGVDKHFRKQLRKRLSRACRCWLVKFPSSISSHTRPLSISTVEFHTISPYNSTTTTTPWVYGSSTELTDDNTNVSSADQLSRSACKRTYM